jgi:hypothetical protein
MTDGGAGERKTGGTDRLDGGSPGVREEVWEGEERRKKNGWGRKRTRRENESKKTGE